MKTFFRILSFIGIFIGMIILQTYYKIGGWEAFGVLLLVGLPAYFHGLFDDEMQKKLIEDKNGKGIKVGDKFKFKLLEDPLHKPTELIGSFSWSDEDLRYEIDIHDNPYFICLSYVNNGTMYDFELL